jgi:hypothetical protein
MASPQAMTEFERFFDEEFPRLLDTVTDNGKALSSGTPIGEASWDRKAAFLLWNALGHSKTATLVDQFEDIL